MSIEIIGLGTAVPTNWLSQDEFCNHAKAYSAIDNRQQKLLADLYRRTTISKRSSVLLEKSNDCAVNSSYFALPGTIDDKGPSTAQRMCTFAQHADNLSERACRNAIKDAGIKSEEITHLITVSCTGFSAPGFDLQLVDSLPLNRDVYRTHLGFMGCHGAMNALRVSEGFCASNSEAKVLLCATEICSLHFQYGCEKNDLIANALFSDGSGAMILGGAVGKIKYVGSGSLVLPDSQDAITWRIGDNGFLMTLSAQANNLIQKYLPEFIMDWLEKYSLHLEDIAGWAVHPGGPKILNAVQACLRLPSASLEMSRWVLAEHGNMSSPTVLFILEQLLKTDKTAPIVMLGFGPGLTVEAALFI